MKPRTRTERDSLGAIAVPATRYWGAQAQRCLEQFAIGTERMPPPLIHALGVVKQAAARVNIALGRLDSRVGLATEKAAEAVARGELDEEFPLPGWQTGSGTQAHMNANEVVASRANEILAGTLGGRDPVHPNDHVNLGQSSNGVVPTAMHVAAVRQLEELLKPALRVNQERISEHVDRSLMLVTALAPHIGYDRAAAIAHHALVNGATLREAAIGLGTVSAEQFDSWVRPSSMATPHE